MLVGKRKREAYEKKSRYDVQEKMQRVWARDGDGEQQRREMLGVQRRV
jgi:hypothetical protein